MFFEFGGNAVHMIQEGVLDCPKGKIADFQVAGLPLPDPVDCFTVRAFDFCRMDISKPSLHFHPAFTIRHIMGSDFLECQSSSDKKFIFTHFLKATTVHLMPQAAPVFHMGENQEKIPVIPFKLLDGFDQSIRTAAIFIFVLLRCLAFKDNIQKLVDIILAVFEPLITEHDKSVNPVGSVIH